MSVRETSRQFCNEKLLDGIRRLPSPQALLAELVETLNREKVDIAALVEKVSRDHALVARVMRIANSPFYGLSGKIGSVRQAVEVLGLNQLREIVTTAMLVDTLPQNNVPFDGQTFWQHAFGTGIAARTLARHLGKNGDTAFTIGLLHDVGRLAAALYAPNEFHSVMTRVQSTQCSVVEAELAVFGVTHAEIGAEIAHHWRFPSNIQDAIRHHHDEPGRTETPLADIINIADQISLNVERYDPSTALEMPPLLTTEAWARLGVEPATLQAVATEVQRTGANVSSLLGI